MTNALIGGWRSGNYLDQPSPWSWAQNYAKSNDTSNMLMQRMMTEAALARMNNQAALERQNNPQSHAYALEIARLQQQGENARLDKKLAADQDVQPVDPNLRAYPTQIIQSMSPMQKRQLDAQYDQIGVDKKNRIWYKRKGAAQNVPNTVAPPATAPQVDFQSVKP